MNLHREIAQSDIAISLLVMDVIVAFFVTTCRGGTGEIRNCFQTAKNDCLKILCFAVILLEENSVGSERKLNGEPRGRSNPK